MSDLARQFGGIDIYLFDQILRGRIRPNQRVFDAGFGSGRNLVYFLRERFDVAGVDASRDAVERVQRLRSELAPEVPSERFRHASLDAHPFEDASFDVSISCAVLHFASGDDAFRRALEGSWRVLEPGGLFFCRLASSIGIEEKIHRIEGRRCHLPDGSDRYLVDEPLLLELTEELGGELADPIKTTVVQGLRSMTTWVVRRR